MSAGGHTPGSLGTDANVAHAHDEPVSPVVFEMFRDGGWQYLLDPRAGAAPVLCYDCTEGAATLLLSRIFRNVTVIHPDAVHLERIRGRVSGDGATGVRYHMVREPRDWEGLPDPEYSGIVIHDIEGAVVRRGPCAYGGLTFAPLLAGVRGVLSPAGFLYLTMRNRISYSRLRDGFSAPVYERCMTGVAARRALESAGFGGIKAYPLILEGRYVAEVVPECGYLAAKGGFSPADKFKQVAMGRRGAPLFAGGYGIVARKDGQPTIGLLERILEGRKEFGLPIAAGRMELKRYLSLNWGKVILSVGTKNSRYGDYILVLTREMRPTLHRRREAEILRALAARGLTRGDCIPQFLGEFQVEGVACFVMRTIPGVSVDRPGPGLEGLTTEAVEFISVFHSETRSAVTVGEPVYKRMFGDLFRQAAIRYAPLARELAELEELVRAGVSGRELPVVWKHGDFKIENMIFGEARMELRGVIDWEHSVRDGLPLLDILYLLTYNRALSGGGDLLPGLRSLVEHGPSEFERRMLATYAGRVPLDPDHVRILLAMFFIHHAGVRYKYILEHQGVLEGLREMLNLLNDVLRGRGAGLVKGLA